MGTDVPTQERSLRSSRYGFAAFWFSSLLIGWTVLRLVFFLAFARVSAAPLSDVFRAFLSGFHRDLFMALVETIPLLLWFMIMPERWFRTRSHRVVFWPACFIFCFAQIFLLFIEFFFFEEFKSRFNTFAVDYLLYPKEVFVNIWESYHLLVFLGICLVVSVGWLLAARRVFRQIWEGPFLAKARLLYFAWRTVLAGLLALTVNLKGANVSHDRTLNEVANNGIVAFGSAWWTHNLDYAAFYKTLPREEAYQRTRSLLAGQNTQFVEEGQSI